MMIVTETLSKAELKNMAEAMFGDMVKAVVDVQRGILAVDAELHADLEALLLENGSRQQDLWGINFYPDAPDDGFVEFHSMINIRPSQGNRSFGVDNEDVRRAIRELVARKVQR